MKLGVPCLTVSPSCRLVGRGSRHRPQCRAHMKIRTSHTEPGSRLRQQRGASERRTDVPSRYVEVALVTATALIRFVPACCAGAALRDRRVCSERLLLPSTWVGYGRAGGGLGGQVGGGECPRSARWRGRSERSARANQSPDRSGGGSVVGVRRSAKEAGTALQWWHRAGLGWGDGGGRRRQSISVRCGGWSRWT